MNRDKKKNRKFIKGTAAHFRRKSTQYHQRKSRERGTFTPRSLARSVSRSIGSAGLEIAPSVAARNFNVLMKQIIKVPPQHRTRRIQKVGG